MIKTVIRHPDNMVMAFDRKGAQIPEYQNRYEIVKESILKNALPDAFFYHILDSAQGKLQMVSREEW